MTIRPIGMAKMMSVALAILMIAAVACTSGEAASQPTSIASDANTAPAADASTGGGESQADDKGVGDEAPGSDAVAAETETAAAVEFEQATGALFLQMISPETDELFVSQGSYEFSGRTTVDALLSVNDTVLEIDEQGHFAFDMDLEEGPNVVEVVASNSLGEQFDRVLLVIYEPA